MQKHNLLSPKPGFMLCLLTLGISISSYAIDPACPLGHALCPEHLAPAQYKTDYNEMINNQVVAAPKVTPQATPKVVPQAVPKVVPQADTDKDGVIDSMDKCPDTPQGYKVDPTGCPVSVCLRLNFAFNSSIIPVSDYPEVDKLAKIMKENPPAKAVIVGHTDHTGTDEYNQKLSERRSKALGDRLIKAGIEADRITTSGKGEKEPIATNSTREGRTLNRRINIELE